MYQKIGQATKHFDRREKKMRSDGLTDVQDGGKTSITLRNRKSDKLCKRELYMAVPIETQNKHRQNI